MKKIFFVTISTAIFGLAFSASCSSDDSHSLLICPDPPAANLSLFDKDIYVKGTLLSTKEEIVTFPDNGINPELINCVIVTDLSNGNTGACVQLQEGGTGYYNLKIKLTSQIGKDINDRIQIFGSQVTPDDPDGSY